MDWIPGDRFGLPLPAHARALQAGGAGFLTAAFQACGTLPRDGRVSELVAVRECAAGSTGRKLFLSVRYAPSTDRLPTELFVKFSRDFDDAIRDRARHQLDAEVRLALLSRSAGFPVAVPRCLFADFHASSGTGVLITERIAYGQAGIEPHHGKCLDDELPQPLEHYRALLRALARLAGAHQSGRLGDAAAREFAFDVDAAMAADRIRYDAAQLGRRMARLADFGAQHPGLLPAHVVAPTFIERLAADVPRFLEQERALQRWLHGDPRVIALCHWNANIDNAWFWRDGRGGLECGLMDWGRVGQMSVAQALLGALIAAETALWDEHLGELLALFVGELQAHGGHRLDVAELQRHLLLFTALMGLAWLMDAPALVRAQLPQLQSIGSRHDPRLRGNETARVQLHMLTTVLHLWQTHDFGRLLDDSPLR